MPNFVFNILKGVQMLKLIWRMIGVLATVIITLLLGVLVGAWFGGNYAENFQFNGVRGYEATSQIGLLCGVFVLILLGAYYWARGRNNNSQNGENN
jgi:cytochrome bd-type quinol oxidase subunit 2